MLRMDMQVSRGVVFDEKEDSKQQPQPFLPPAVRFEFCRKSSVADQIPLVDGLQRRKRYQR